MPSRSYVSSSASAESRGDLPSTDRRRFLAATAATAAFGTAGCLGLLDGNGDSGSSSTGANWGTYRGDWQRTGRASADAGPGESLSIDWETSVLDVVEEREDVSAQRFSELVDDSDGYGATGVCLDVTLTDDLVLTTVNYRLYQGEEQESNWGGVVALDAASGSVEWSISGLPAEMQAPTVIEDRLYLSVLYPVDADVEGPHLLVADAASGTVEARHTIQGERRSIPTVTGDGVYHLAPEGADGEIVAIDPDSGDRSWLADAPRPLPELHLFTITEGAIVYAGRVDEETQALVALDPDTGDELWQRSLDLSQPRPFVAPESLGTPSVVDGTGYVAGQWTSFTADDARGAALRSFDLDGGADRWTFRPDGVPYEEVSGGGVASQCAEDEDCSTEYAALHGTPLVVDDLVVVAGFGEPAPDGSPHQSHRHLYAVSASDGSLEWTIPGVAAPPVAAGDVIYARLPGDVLIAISTDGTVLDRAGTDGDPSWGWSPAIGHGRVYSAWSSEAGGGPGTPDTIAAIE